MTYMISHQGKTYERDLGAETSKVAGAMSAFDPGEGWTLLE